MYLPNPSLFFTYLDTNQCLNVCGVCISTVHFRPIASIFVVAT